MKRVLTATCCVIALAPAVASANTPPPPGLYRCVTPENDRHFANLRIIGTDEYRWKGNGQTGRYRTNGRRITFTTGPLQRIFPNGELLRAQRFTLIDLFHTPNPGGPDDVHCRHDR